MFVDEVIIEVKAGNGGDGCTAFRREKYIPMGGPFGGNGGKGADIIFKVDMGLRTLLDLRYNKHIKGHKGSNGLGKNMNGKNAENIIIKVPQGTTVTDLDTGLILADPDTGQEGITLAAILLFGKDQLLKVEEVEEEILHLQLPQILHLTFLKMVNQVKKED